MPKKATHDLVDGLFDGMGDFAPPANSGGDFVDASIVEEPGTPPRSPDRSGNFAAHSMPSPRPQAAPAPATGNTGMGLARSTVNHERVFQPVQLRYSAAPRLQMTCMYVASFLLPHLLGCFLKSTPLGMWENFGIGSLALLGAVYWLALEQLIGTEFARKNPWICNMTLHGRVAAGALGFLAGYSGALNVFRGAQMFQGATPWS